MGETVKFISISMFTTASPGPMLYLTSSIPPTHEVSGIGETGCWKNTRIPIQSFEGAVNPFRAWSNGFASAADRGWTVALCQERRVMKKSEGHQVFVVCCFLPMIFFRPLFWTHIPEFEGPQHTRTSTVHFRAVHRLWVSKGPGKLITTVAKTFRSQSNRWVGSALPITVILRIFLLLASQSLSGHTGVYQNTLHFPGHC